MAAMPRASAMTISAYPPSTVTPGMTGFWQFTMFPRRHGSQTPSSPPKKPTPTRWPAFQRDTPPPNASMRPTISCPGTRGRLNPGYIAVTVAASVWQTPQASTRILTWPAPGSRIGRSTTRSTPGAETSTAWYLSAISVPLVLTRFLPRRAWRNKGLIRIGGNRGEGFGPFASRRTSLLGRGGQYARRGLRGPEELVPERRPGGAVGSGHCAVQELQGKVQPRPPGRLAVA